MDHNLVRLRAFVLVVVRIAIAVVAAGLLVVASPAGASRLDLSRTCGKHADCSFVVRYTAAPGERNDVRMVRTGQTLVVSDSGAVITATAGVCVSGGHVVMCMLPAPEPVSPIVIDGGDGDDRLDTTGMLSRAVLDGGPGDDTLISSGFGATLSGGPGNDLIDAGANDSVAGADTVTYADHREPVRVDLQARTATTASGERDVLVGVENVIGTRHADVLYGDAAANILKGNGGRDDIRGRDGVDTLVGGGRLDGGRGADHLRPIEGGRAVCGRGEDDRVSARVRSLVLDETCAYVFMGGLRVMLSLGHRDPRKDVIAVEPQLFIGQTDTIVLGLERAGRSLGRVRKPITHSGHTVKVHVRLNREGRRVARARAPVRVSFGAHQRRKPGVGGTFTLRFNP